jgi:hypothetical protein
MLTSIRLIAGRRFLATCLALGLVTPGATTEWNSTHQFSADIVSRDAAGAVVGPAARLYVANRRVRIEMAGAHSEFFLIDGDTGTALFVRPAQEVFMDARLSTPLTQVFVPVDPIDPCPQWQAAASNAGPPNTGNGWRCARIDPKAVDGRGSIEYDVVSTGQTASRRWIDRALEFPVKLQSADGTSIALEHIRLEAQPAILFALPRGYRKFEPQALIERIKRSDVWAERPQ